MNIKVKKGIWLAGGMTLLAAWVFFVGFQLLAGGTKIETQAADENLSAIAVSNAANVQAIFERYVNTLEILAAAQENFTEDMRNKTHAILKNVAQQKGLEGITIDFVNGESYTAKGLVVGAKPYMDFKTLKEKAPYISDVERLSVLGSTGVNIVVPVFNEAEEVIASVRCEVRMTSLSKIFEQTFANVKGQYYLIDGNGNYIAGQGVLEDTVLDGKYFKTLDTLVFAQGFSAEKMLRAFSEKEKGYAKYKHNGKDYYAYYMPVEINNWVLFMPMTRAIVEEKAQRHTIIALSAILQIVAIFLLFTLYIYFNRQNQHKCAILDEQRFKALAEQTGKVIFEWDFATNRITAMSNFKALFGRELATQSSPEDALKVEAVHAEDKDVFANVFRTILSGNPVNNARFRVLDGEGTYHWCALSGLVINDEKGRPYKAVGTLESVDAQMKKEEGLKQKAEKDQLTNLYNKATTEILIKNILSAEENKNTQYALLIIDVDNFKSVNDRLGHLYGDVVLASLASTLKGIFRANDIIGRIGGDEFFVFLESGNVNLIRNKAEEICRLFRNTYVEGEVATSISASVGISLAPSHGRDFDQLYKNADIALYLTKLEGKNNYTVFSGQSGHFYQSARTEIDNQGLIQKNFKDNRLEYVFKILYQSENPNVAVQSVLQLVSEHLGFTRGYIFENSDTEICGKNTFAWCASGVMPITEMEKKNCLKTPDSALEQLRKKGIFIMSSSARRVDKEEAGLTDQSVKSAFLLAIKNEGELLGFIGFDSCRQEHFFTPEIIDELCAIGNVLSVFIVKQRGLETAKQNHQLLLNVMNHIEGYAYVVDRESYRILYENQRVIDLLNGEENVGKVCFTAYTKRGEPCEACPIKGITAEKYKNEIKMYNEEFSILSKTFAVEMDWLAGQKAYMINSFEIKDSEKKN